MPFGKELTDQTVGVFVRASLPAHSTDRQSRSSTRPPPPVVHGRQTPFRCPVSMSSAMPEARHTELLRRNRRKPSGRADRRPGRAKGSPTSVRPARQPRRDGPRRPTYRLPNRRSDRGVDDGGTAGNAGRSWQIRPRFFRRFSASSRCSANSSANAIPAASLPSNPAIDRLVRKLPPTVAREIAAGTSERFRRATTLAAAAPARNAACRARRACEPPKLRRRSRPLFGPPPAE